MQTLAGQASLIVRAVVVRLGFSVHTLLGLHKDRVCVYMPAHEMPPTL